MPQKVAGGKYTLRGATRYYDLTTAVTANSTIVTGGRQGDIVKTSHATGRMSIFVLDGSSKAQYLTNA